MAINPNHTLAGQIAQRMRSTAEIDNNRATIEPAAQASRTRRWASRAEAEASFAARNASLADGSLNRSAARCRGIPRSRPTSRRCSAAADSAGGAGAMTRRPILDGFNRLGDRLADLGVLVLRDIEGRIKHLVSEQLFAANPVPDPLIEALQQLAIGADNCSPKVTTARQLAPGTAGRPGGAGQCLARTPPRCTGGRQTPPGVE